MGIACARKQRRKNAVVFTTEVVDSLLGVERHSGTVTGLPPQERLQKHIHCSLQLLLYPQTKVGDILDSGPSRRRRRRRRNFLVDAITQKQINIFFSNLVHMLRVPKGRSLF